MTVFSDKASNRRLTGTLSLSDQGKIHLHAANATRELNELLSVHDLDNKRGEILGIGK
jgi:hypothetical protein